jgi:hypothetical protein
MSRPPTAKALKKADRDAKRTKQSVWKVFPGSQGWCEQPFPENIVVSANAAQDCKRGRHAGLTRGLGLAIEILNGS